MIADAGARLRHDCAGTPGHRGAPLLVRGADGVWRIAGLEVAAFRAGRGGIAVSAATLQAWLAEPGASP